MCVRASHIVLAFLAGAWATGVSTTDSTSNLHASREGKNRGSLQTIVFEAERLSVENPGSYRHYLTQLAREQNFAALRAIYECSFASSDWAAQETARIMTGRDNVRLCRTFRPGSDNWSAAFSILSHHEKADVITYIKEMVRSPDPLVRCHCYGVCLAAGWDDLIESARNDQDNRSSLPLLNAEVEELVLGFHAKQYLEHCELLREAGNTKSGRKLSSSSSGANVVWPDQYSDLDIPVSFPILEQKNASDRHRKSVPTKGTRIGPDIRSQ